MRRRVNRGEIGFVDLEPSAGSEQRGKRPVLVLTEAKHNSDFPAIVAPISRGVEPPAPPDFRFP